MWKPGVVPQGVVRLRSGNPGGALIGVCIFSLRFHPLQVIRELRPAPASSCFRGSSAMLLAIRSSHSPLRCRQGPASSPTSISEEQVRISNCAAVSRPVPWRLVLFCISTAAIKNQTGQADFIASSWNKTLKLTLRVWCLDLPKRLHAHAPEVAPCAQPARFWARFPSQWCHGIVSRLEGCVVSHRSIREWLDSNPSIPWR